MPNSGQRPAAPRRRSRRKLCASIATLCPPLLFPISCCRQEPKTRADLFFAACKPEPPQRPSINRKEPEPKAKPPSPEVPELEVWVWIWVLAQSTVQHLRNAYEIGLPWNVGLPPRPLRSLHSPFPRAPLRSVSLCLPPAPPQCGSRDRPQAAGARRRAGGAQWRQATPGSVRESPEPHGWRWSFLVFPKVPIWRAKFSLGRGIISVLQTRLPPSDWGPKPLATPAGPIRFRPTRKMRTPISRCCANGCNGLASPA